jgi:3-hydroxy acid dehydrogenase / malonic semialdehyde reductase
MAEENHVRKGSVALVTGAGGGIGQAIAEALTGIGCRVVCAGRRVDRIETVAKRLGSSTHAVQLDVADQNSVDSLFDRLPKELHEIDILVNNAGHDVGGRHRFDEGVMADWQSIVETNFIGLVRVTHKVVPGMIARDRGHIVNLGSIAGTRGYAGGTLYAGSKFAVHGFSESLRLDFRNTGIRVTEILPGMVHTDFAFNRWRGDRERAENFYRDFGVCLAPADVARTVVFAVQQPPHVVIAQLMVLPISQS